MAIGTPVKRLPRCGSRGVRTGNSLMPIGAPVKRLSSCGSRGAQTGDLPMTGITMHRPPQQSSSGA